MNKNRLFHLLTVLVIGSMLAVGCTPAASTTATAAPPVAATQPATTVNATAGPTACAPAQANWDPASGDVGSKSITVAFEQEPDQVVGLFSTMSFSAWIWQMVGAGPGRWDDKNNFVPYFATEIPTADNGGVSAD